LIRRLGAGGMGEVYLAEDTQLERPVALKVMSAELAKEPNQRKRFRTEAKAASGLNHPHICMIHDVGETTDGCPFLVMEYVEGQTLDKVLQARRLSLSELLNFGIEVAEALDAAHARGLVHRDIKPANLMVDRQGRVKVMDFGLAKRFTPDQLSDTLTSAAHTRTGMLIGTPQYMSPEQALGHLLDPGTDIFSLGAVLYEVAVGQRPFLGRTVGESINNIVNQTPAPLDLADPLLSPALDKIIFKCLEKDPAKRYASAKQLADDLRKLKEDSERAPAAATPEGAAAPISTDRGEQQATALWKLAAKTNANRNAALARMVAIIVVLVSAAAGWVFLRSGKSKSPALSTNDGGTAERRSVAVLPFVNLSGDKTNEYLSEGISEEIIARLSKLRGLKVPASSSCFAFKDKQTKVREIGRSLQVSTVLKGSVGQTGDQLRFMAQLVNVADGSTIWSNTYDRTLEELPEIGSVVARDVVQALLPVDAKQMLMKLSTTNAEAYNCYLQGRSLWEHRTKEDFIKAIGRFKDAIDNDPVFAQAYAGLADCYFLCWEGLPREKAFARMQAAASKALELDPTLGEPHAVLACVKAYLDWDWTGAEKEFRRAIELNPNYATAHLWFARTLKVLRRSDEALAEIERAHELDLYSPVINGFRGGLLAESGRADEAIRLLREQNQRQPSILLRSALASAYAAKGMWAPAIAELETLPMDDANWVRARAALGFAHARAGNINEAQRILGQILEMDRQADGKGGSIEAALVQHALGEDEFAVDTLERVFAENPTGLQDINSDSEWGDLRQHPRVQTMLRKINLVK
jgi:eukaryotic-like serine/threonine-protein kinase